MMISKNFDEAQDKNCTPCDEEEFSAKRSEDDMSLESLLAGYVDDGIREPLIDLGESVGREMWLITKSSQVFAYFTRKMWRNYGNL